MRRKYEPVGDDQENQLEHRTEQSDTAGRGKESRTEREKEVERELLRWKELGCEKRDVGQVFRWEGPVVEMLRQVRNRHWQPERS